MNSDTDFHELGEQSEASKALMEEKKNIIKRHHQNQRARGVRNPLPLHPRHVDLVLRANKKPVPAHWPIFTIGEEIEMGGSVAKLLRVNMRDLLLKFNSRAVGWERYLLLSGEFEIKGHKFRCRMTRGEFIVIRPLKGRPRNYVK